MSDQSEYPGHNAADSFHNGIHQSPVTATLQGRDVRKDSLGFLPKLAPQLGDKIDLKLLVLCPTADDPNAAAISSILDHIGIPFDIVVAERECLTKAKLWNGNHAHYQGVILSTGGLGYWNAEDNYWIYTLDEEQKQLLTWYQIRFGIRQVTLFALPGESPEGGLQIGAAIDTYTSAVEVTLTEAAQPIFNYLRPSATIPVVSVAAFVAYPTDDATQPLLKNAAGGTMAALYCQPDGREQLTLTFGQSKSSLHTLLFGYGLIHWVTRGVFLGRRRVHLAIHVDDIFNGNQLWDPETLSDETGERHRLDENDIQALLRWLEQLNAKRNCADITLDLAFNGASIDSSPLSDALATALLPQQCRFRWINHGFTHLTLDSANYKDSYVEIELNNELALRLGLIRYSLDCMVTASLSGLKNPDFLAAANALGIRQLISDTSQQDGNNPSPNVGIVSPFQPQILIIPRHPNNLFFNVSMPQEWVSQFNVKYRELWQRDLTFTEIVDYEARVQLLYMLASDLDPWMFHQANLRTYDGTHSLLTDLIDRVIELYNQFCGDLSVINLGMYEIGQLMARRAQSNQAEIWATLTLGSGLEITADREITLPITGAAVPGAIESYAGESISILSLERYATFRVPMDNLVGYQSSLPASA